MLYCILFLFSVFFFATIPFSSSDLEPGVCPQRYTHTLTLKHKLVTIQGQNKKEIEVPISALALRDPGAPNAGV